MSKGPHVLVLAGVALALAANPLTAGAAARSSWRPEVSASVRKVMRENSIPGAVVGLWRRGQRPYVKAFGIRDKATGRRMAPGLYMRIGSVTKTFTATAVLQLVDQGKVGLDDPISTYVAGVPNGDAITIRQLAGMRSGLADYSASSAWNEPWFSNPRRHWTPAELLPYAYAEPPLYAPGAWFNYSNSNYVLLGLVVEHVTGQTLSAYIDQHIFEPERMTHTVFPTDAAFARPHAQGYTRQTRSGRVAAATGWDPSWAGAAGAMISTLGDLRIWARDLATGRLLSRATQRERTRFIAIAELPPARYGLGLSSVNGWIGHNGSLPGYQSLVAYLPAKHATMVLLMNSDISPPYGNLSTIVAAAITKVITPRHVYDYSAASP